jgi:hypothetical protein
VEGWGRWCACYSCAHEQCVCHQIFHVNGGGRGCQGLGVWVCKAEGMESKGWRRECERLAAWV